jgi:NAD(P)-dependent dehydrogenase (short-subunit alcohol dehydrogenase family)
VNAVPQVSRTSFEGRTVWVTGCARGQGFRHVERFAAAGARVGCIDIDVQGLDHLANRVRGAGGHVATVRADVSSWHEMRSAADYLQGELGDVDIVVANAGIVGNVAPVEALDPPSWAEVIAVNLTGAFHTVKAAVPQVCRSADGTIVLVASAASFFAYPGYAAYSASKHGMLGLMRALANELGARKVRVNAVCPGWVDTPMLDHEAAAAGLPRDVAVAGWVREHVIERLVTPDEVSDAVLWLASPAAAMVTGVALPIDGGQLVRRGQEVAGSQ